MNKNKKFKGMTLLEVIVAMVVMVIISSMLVLCASSVLNNRKTARTVITTVNNQAPDVEKRRIATPYAKDDVLNLQYNGAAFTIPVDKYQADPVLSDENGVTLEPKSGNLKYFEVD